MTGDVDGALKYWKQAQEVGSESKTLKKKIEKRNIYPNENVTQQIQNGRQYSYAASHASPDPGSRSFRL